MPLQDELTFFDSVKEELVQHHEGKFVVIIGHEQLGIFDRIEDAYKAGVDQRGNVPMLIKRISKEEPVESLPALSIGLISADL